MAADVSIKDKLRRALRLDLALRFVWRSTPRWTIANLVLVIIQGPLPLVPLYFMKLLVDTLTSALSAPVTDTMVRQIVLLIVLTGVTALFSSFIGTLAGLINEAQSMAVGDYMQNIVHAKSIEVDLEYYENPAYYDTLRRAQQEAPYRPLHVLYDLIQLGQNSLSLLATAGFLLVLHWSIGIVLFVAVIPGILVQLRFSRRLYDRQRAWTPLERKAGYFDWLLTGYDHAKENRLFDLGPLFIRRFQESRKQLRQERLQIARQRSVADFGAQVITQLTIYGVYAFIALQAVHGNLTLGDFVMYYQIFQRGQSFLKAVLGSLAGLYEDNLFLSNLYDFLDLKPKLTEPAHPRPVPHPMQTGIVFDHVSFQYPNSARLALEDISLTIRPGEKVALVGENGSGKTTLTKLLCRLYDPTNGRITLDNADLRQFNTTALRREMSVLLQDYAHYNLTARENIWLGNAASPPDQEAILAAARQAGADDVIAGLKDGYDTILGKFFLDGEELSIGEWQKVALSRAFLRDAPLIILDEPTSAMDANAEYQVFQKLRALTEGRSVVLISHRFSTVRMADCIYVLENGRIAESGDHDTLMRLGGNYATMFSAQAQYYQ